MFGDPARTVTVRAEMSRVRRYLGAFLDHRPYRFTERADVEVLLPEAPLDLLPHSVAPGVVRARGAAPAGRPHPFPVNGSCPQGEGSPCISRVLGVTRVPLP